jgi:thiol-disulfide isomerase/thioredoxin
LLPSSSFLNWKLLAGIVVLSMAAVGIVIWTSTPTRVPGRIDPKLGFTLKDLDGRDVRLSDLKGKPLLINFWETFCVPCQYETPELVALHDKYKDRGLTIVGISMHDEVPDIRAFVEKYKMTYTVLVGGERDDIASAFAIMGYPTTFFVRADGTISDVQLGYATGEMEKKIQALF